MYINPIHGTNSLIFEVPGLNHGINRKEEMVGSAFNPCCTGTETFAWLISSFQTGRYLIFIQLLIFR